METFCIQVKHIESIIEPENGLQIIARLRPLDAQVRSYYNTWLSHAEKGQGLKLCSDAYLYIANTQIKLENVCNVVPSHRLRAWLVNRGAELEVDTIPVPSSHALLGVLYRRFKSVEEKIEQTIEAKLGEYERVFRAFKLGIVAFQKTIEEEIEKRYEKLKPIVELIEQARKVSDGVLDENWALSALALSLVENLVNLKLKELGESTKGSFKEREERLKKALIEKMRWSEREASELARILREKYEGRSIVVHGGYENPTTEKLAREDLQFVKHVISKLFSS